LYATLLDVVPISRATTIVREEPEVTGVGCFDSEGERKATNKVQASIRKVDNDCFLPFPDLFVREGGEQE